MYKVILFSIAAIVLTIIFGGLYQISVIDPQLWGRTLPKEYSEKICNDAFSIKKSHCMNFISGAFADNKSKSMTSICHFKLCSNESAKCVAIIGYLDELIFADSLVISEKEFQSFFSYKDDKTVEEVENTYRVYMPWTLFNIRILPKGRFLSLNGFSSSPKTPNEYRIGEYQVKSVEGTFQNLAFIVLPNKGFIKNIVKELRFYESRYGTIYFLKKANRYVAMLIASVPLNEQSQYGQYTEELRTIIAGLNVKRYK